MILGSIDRRQIGRVVATSTDALRTPVRRRAVGPLADRMGQDVDRDKTARGNASQFYVAGELCRRGYSAVVTLGNTPNTDVLCSNREGTRFAHIQVKTFVPGTKTCSVGLKAERVYGVGFFWVLAGVPVKDSREPFQYFIIPASEMARNVASYHRRWLAAPGKGGRQRRDSKVRAVGVERGAADYFWYVGEYFDRWDLIDQRLSETGHEE